MALPQPVLDFINESAETNDVARPSNTDDLFKLGAVDSFSLVDLVAVIEENCGIKIPDGDVTPGNFQTIDGIEQYIARKQA
jgi:acyl carrier protein